MIDSQGYVYDWDCKGNTVEGLQMLSPLSETKHIYMGLADLELDLDIDQREIVICIIIKEVTCCFKGGNNSAMLFFECVNVEWRVSKWIDA